jgi:hypothetical protein
MKLLIFLAVWRRPEITEICFMGIDRLRKSGLYDIDTMAVISEKSMIPLCNKYGIDFIEHKNEPLGEKKNVGLNYAMLKSWDYLIEIGSDDLLKTEVLECYKPFFERGEEFFGIKDFIFLNSEDGQCRRLKSDTIYGAGRCISRKLIERLCYGVDFIAKEGIMSPGRTVGAGHKGFFPVAEAMQMEKIGRIEIIGKPRYRLWKDDLMKGLDNSSTYFFHKQFVPHRTVPTENALGIDIKSKENIWAFTPDLGEPHDLAEAMIGLSADEKIALLNLIKNKNRCTVETAVLR